MKGRLAGFLCRRFISLALLTPSAFIWPGVAPASAIPAYARQYDTSCLTCHTIYPKLNPFGEAFRRNGHRFPGVDSDYVKQDTVTLGQPAYKKMFPRAVWPGSIPAGVPLAVGFSGQATTHPNTSSSQARDDNGSWLNLDDLVEEGSLFAGGSVDDTVSFFGELATSSDATEIEHARLGVNDVIGPKHAVNIFIGKLGPTLSSFGHHSSYLADAALPSLPTTALYGARSDSWNLAGVYNGLEVNGILSGRIDYSLGLNAGANVDTRNPGNAYAHLGWKPWGKRLDGEGTSGPTDAMKPWAENALTLDAFYYRATSRFMDVDSIAWTDAASAWGGGIRIQAGSLELSSGLYREDHDHAIMGGIGAVALAQYDELSYVAYPWLVPAVRLEYLRLSPDAGPTVSDTRIMAGAAALLRANVRLSLVAWIESASGAPDAGWGASGGFATPGSENDSVSAELEGIVLGLSYVF